MIAAHCLKASSTFTAPTSFRRGAAAFLSPSVSLGVNGRTSYLILIARRASRACSSVSAATAAISSPPNRSSAPAALIGCTALTPGIFSAAERSISAIFACAWGERRILPNSMPGRLRSKEYFALPLTFREPSRRGTLVPITCLFSGHL